jgi:hypothetical protein
VTSALFAKGLVYADSRQAELRVRLGDLDLPIDTTHLERALRVIPMVLSLQPGEKVQF